MGLYDRNYNKQGGFGSFSLFPPVIKNLLIINAAVFVLMFLMGRFLFGGVPVEQIIFNWFALMPLGYGFQIWQLITYQFLHGGFSHILFNMFALWMFGADIENTYGSKKFLLYYLLCGIGAGLLHLFLSPVLTGALAPTIGASGAIYGVMIAFAMFFPDRLIFLYFFIPVKAKYFIALMVVFDFIAVPNGDSTAHLAHLGGGLVGFLFILFDKDSMVSFKQMFGASRRGYAPPRDVFQKPVFKNPFKKTEPDVEDAKFYDVNNEDHSDVTQEDIDKILDKISQSGYKNLTEREKKILFEASRKM
ncbi:MAG: rhomboid family intramembrane serine protease [Ignavibacteriaceae bacterium]|jgi:membrane associated rhomboid family serine protease